MVKFHLLFCFVLAIDGVADEEVTEGSNSHRNKLVPSECWKNWTFIQLSKMEQKLSPHFFETKLHKNRGVQMFPHLLTCLECVGKLQHFSNTVPGKEWHHEEAVDVAQIVIPDDRTNEHSHTWTKYISTGYEQARKARRCDSRLQIWNYHWLTDWLTD